MKATPRTIKLRLSRSDRDLIREHGYPFPDIQAALDAVPETEDVAVVTCDEYYVELLLGDLATSINECSDYELQDRLNELYECIESEAAIQHDDAGARRVFEAVADQQGAMPMQP